MSNDSKRRAEEWARHHMTYRGIDPLGHNAKRPKIAAHFAAAIAQAEARGRREGLEEAASLLRDKAPLYYSPLVADCIRVWSAQIRALATDEVTK